VNPAPNWVERGLPFLRPIAENLSRRLPRSIDVDDLIGAGQLALVELAGGYDPARCPDFDMWIKFRIRAAMIDSIKGKPFRESRHATLKDVAPARSESPEQTATRALEMREARRAVARLPEAQRSLIACLVREGGPALSRKTGLPESTARRRVAGYLRRIRPRPSSAALAEVLGDSATFP